MSKFSAIYGNLQVLMAVVLFSGCDMWSAYFVAVYKSGSFGGVSFSTVLQSVLDS